MAIGAVSVMKFGHGEGRAKLGLQPVMRGVLFGTNKREAGIVDI
ncbi:hypothetical protein [Mariprofundus erugo]|nr:hypothetical protein [Mariprofundus erugo]